MVVKRLVAIEDLGNVEVLCTDKTGTLTQGRIRFDAALYMAGASSAEVLRLGLLCNEAVVEGGRVVAGNPLDEALWEAALGSNGPGGVAGAGAGRGSADGVDPLGGARRLALVPFDYDRQLASVLVAEPDSRCRVVTKGAPEAVLARCSKLPAAARPQLDRLFARQGPGLWWPRAGGPPVGRVRPRRLLVPEPVAGRGRQPTARATRSRGDPDFACHGHSRLIPVRKGRARSQAAPAPPRHLFSTAASRVRRTSKDQRARVLAWTERRFIRPSRGPRSQGRSPVANRSPPAQHERSAQAGGEPWDRMGLDADAALAWGAGPAAMVRYCRHAGMSPWPCGPRGCGHRCWIAWGGTRWPISGTKLAGVATVLTWWGGMAGAERGSCVSVGSVPRGSAPGAAPSGRARPGAPMADGASPSPVWAAGRHAAVVNGPIGGVQ
jgi:Cation transport ATPase (P-type)